MSDPPAAVQPGHAPPSPEDRIKKSLMASQPAFVEALQADLRAVLDRGGVDAPPNDGTRALVAALGPTIVTGASRAITDPRLDGLGARVATGEEAAVVLVAALATTLLRWRQLLLREGTAAFRDGRARDARLAAELVLATTLDWNTHPENASAFVLAGRVAKLRNDLGSALQYFDAAVTLARGRADQIASIALDSLGLALSEVGRPDDALAAFAEALSVEPTAQGRADILANRALVLDALGEHRQGAVVSEEVVASLRAADAPPSRLAVALDNAAMSHAALGDGRRAREYLDEARELFRTGAPDVDRARNALSRATILSGLGDATAAADAFAEAYRLTAGGGGEIDLAHYTAGRAARLGASQAAARDRLTAELGSITAAETEQERCRQEGGARLQRGLDLLHRAAWPDADAALAEAAGLLDRAGDARGSLMAVTNRGTLRMDAGRTAEAIEFLMQTQAFAHQLGAAREEMMALANLANLGLAAADVGGGIGVLDLLMRAAAIERALPTIADGLGLDAGARRALLWGEGAIDEMIARYCADRGADELAEPHWERSLEAGRRLGAEPASRFRLGNRLANRLVYLNRSRAPAAAERAAAVAGELAEVIAASPDVPRLQLMGHRALALYEAERDAVSAIAHLRAAATTQAALCAQVPPAERAGVISTNPVPFRLLARLLVAAGDATAGWAALQGAKGRRVLEAVGDDLPADLPSVQAALGRLGASSFVADLAVSDDGLVGFVVGVDSCAAIGPLALPPGWLATTKRGDVRERERRAIECCLGDDTLRQLVTKIESELPAGTDVRVFVVPDELLANLPLHLVPAAGASWGDQRTLSLLPAAGLVTAFSGAAGGRAAQSLVAGDSDGSLPGARRECLSIATALGVDPLVGEQCTFAAMAHALEGGRLDVIHLAVHGRGDSQRGGRAALLFAGDGGGVWVPFCELLQLGLDAELVVLSGCSTAVSGPVHGQAAVSAAQAALEAGAGAVLACLWPVDDAAATTYMEAFYGALVPVWRDGPADLRTAIRAGRNAVRGTTAGAAAPDAVRRDGRRNLEPEDVDIADPLVRDALRWAPFVLFGDPIVAG